jgi:hypothetical protein
MTEEQRIKANKLIKEIGDLSLLLRDIDPSCFTIGDDQSNCRTFIYNKSIRYKGNDIEKSISDFIIPLAKEVTEIAWQILKPKLEAKLEALKKEFNEL